jgi:hypothetical protein
LDDVARLAIVALGLRRTAAAHDEYDRILTRSLSFVRHAWDPARRGMRNFLSYDRRWLDEGHGGDHLGRAAWALGEVIGAGLDPAVRDPSVILLREMFPALEEQRSPRTMAFTVLGLARVDSPTLGERGSLLMQALAHRLADQQRANATADWYWAEDVLTYDDARLPQALIAAGARLGDSFLRDEGLRALDWYAAECDVDGPFVRHVGHLGRRRGEPAPGAGDEQPINAAALVEAHAQAHLSGGPEAHAHRAMRAFEWFLGRNRLRLPVYDFSTGGCHDGLGETTVNGNQGAESTLAYLQALLALDDAGLQATLHG